MTALVERDGTMSKRLLAKALMRMATQDIVRAPFAIKTLFPSALLYCASCVHVAVVKFLDWEKVELQDKDVSTEASHTVHLGKRCVDVFCRLQHCEKDAGYQEGVSAKSPILDCQVLPEPNNACCTAARSGSVASLPEEEAYQRAQ